MTTYYKADLTQITVKEIFKNSPNIGISIACLIGKIFPTQVSSGVPRSKKINIFDEELLSKEWNLDYDKYLSGIQDSGFKLSFFCDMFPPLLGKSSSFIGVLLSDDSLILAFIFYLLIRLNNVLRREVYYSFYTKLSNGHFLIATSNNKTFKLIAPEFHVYFKPLKSPKKVLEYHRNKLNDFQPIFPVSFDEEKLEETILDLSKRDIDYQIEKGYFVPLTDEEIRSIS
jgi:hypothetical protein